MADGTVLTGATGIAIDNTLVSGTTIYRQRIVIGSDTIMRKWAARPFLHIRRRFGRELAMSRFLQQRAGEVIE